MLAVMETQQHLDLLAYQERVLPIEDDTTSRFVPSANEAPNGGSSE
jgi:hypothetical protein